MQNGKWNGTGEKPASNVYPGKGRQKHWVSRRCDAASHGAVNPITQDDAIHLHLGGDFCMSRPCEGHSETFLEAQGGQIFLCAECYLRKLLSRQALPILQNQTAKLYPLLCHLLRGLPLHITCVFQAPMSGSSSGRGIGYMVGKCSHQTAQQTRNWSGHLSAGSDARCLQASREYRSVSLLTLWEPAGL